MVGEAQITIAALYFLQINARPTMAKLNSGQHPKAAMARSSPMAVMLNANPALAAKRKADIFLMKDNGENVSAIAQHFGVSTQRIRQILSKPYVTPKRVAKIKSVQQRRPTNAMKCASVVLSAMMGDVG